MRLAPLAVVALTLAGSAPAALPAPTATLAFARSDVAGGGIYVVAGGRTRPVAPHGIQPAWSPDSRRLAYVAPGADGAGDVYAIDADGRWKGRITHTTADETHPDWSADGRRLAVERDAHIVVVRADGGRERRLAPGHEPDWAPDGRRIAFASGGDLYTIDAATKRITRLTSTPAEERSPAWSPDGRRIVYVADDGAQADLYILTVGSRTTERLTTDLGVERSPRFSTDGRRLLYVYETAGAETVWSLRLDSFAAAPIGLPPLSVDPEPRPVPPRPFELLPDLEQRPPADLSIKKERRGRRTHYRLGFDSATDNLGDGPMTLLASRPSRRASTMSVAQRVELGSGGRRLYGDVGVLRYVYSPTHTHWHVMDFQRYELRRLSDHALVVRDRKSGFCLADHWAHAPGRQPAEPPHPVFRDYCERGNPNALSVRQGTSVGYTDKYPSHFHGQSLDLARVPAGLYVLVNRANPELLMRELRYDNNAASIRVRLTWHRRTPRVRILKTCPDSDRC